MFPVLTVLFPELARAAAQVGVSELVIFFDQNRVFLFARRAMQYRFDRLSASETNAALSGYDGAMWSWESAYTGLWTAPWRAADLSENHIDVCKAQGVSLYTHYWYSLFCVANIFRLTYPLHIVATSMQPTTLRF